MTKREIVKASTMLKGVGGVVTGTMNQHLALALCRREVENRGFTASSGSWCEPGRAFAFSVESAGPDTYGHSLCAIEARKNDDDNTWMFYYENSPIPALFGLG